MLPDEFLHFIPLLYVGLGFVVLSLEVLEYGGDTGCNLVHVNLVGLVQELFNDGVGNLLLR